MLRDEVYCQIMRQLTRNKNPSSEERGWELMWMATGIMTCSPILRKELGLFLNSRNNALAKECLERLFRIEQLDELRIYPPYILEVETIKSKNLQIFHKIYFPDGTETAFEVSFKNESFNSTQPCSFLFLRFTPRLESKI